MSSSQHLWRVRRLRMRKHLRRRLPILPSSGRSRSTCCSATFSRARVAPALTPPADGTYQFVAFKTTGTNPGYDVRDGSGRLWSVKLGIEAQSEVTASRILWAMGFHQPATYYLPQFTLSGDGCGHETSGAVPYRPRAMASRRRVVVVRQSIRRHAAVSRLDRRAAGAERVGSQDVEQPDLRCRGSPDAAAPPFHGPRRRRVARPGATVCALHAAGHARVARHQEQHRGLRAAGIHHERRRATGWRSTIEAGTACC